MARAAFVFVLALLAPLHSSGVRTEEERLWVGGGEDGTSYDLVFVIDGSGSAPGDWARTKSWVKDAAKEFSQGGSPTLATVVLSGSPEDVEDADASCTGVSIPQGESQDFEKCVDAIEQFRGYSRVDSGLKSVLDRPVPDGHQQVVVILLDGYVYVQWNDAAALAGQIKARGGIVFALSADEEAEPDQLAELSSGTEFFSWRVADASKLSAVIPVILDVVAGVPDGQPPDGGDGDLDAALADSTRRSVKKKMLDINGRAPRRSRCGNGCIMQAFHGMEEYPGGPPEGGLMEVADKLETLKALGFALMDAENTLVRNRFHEFGLKLLYGIRKAIQTEEVPRRLLNPIWQLTTEKELIDYLDYERNPSEFCTLLSLVILQGAELARTDEALLLVAEYRGLHEEGLLATDAMDDELDKLRGKLAERARRQVMQANHVEDVFPLVREIYALSDAWQEAWGKVRVYAKVTTQCSVVVPKDEVPDHFMGEPRMQKYWSKCRGATPFAEDEFPSAIATCERFKDLAAGDTDDAKFVKEQSLSVDRLVRFLGCGANRKKVEPRVDFAGPRTMCQQTVFGDRSEGGGNKKLYNSLCSERALSERTCHVFGPFWGIYAAKLDHIFGIKSRLEQLEASGAYTEACHQGYGKEPCGNAQIEGFKAMINEANAQYIYGELPALPVSQATAYKYNKKPVAWQKDQMAWPMPYMRIRSPPISHVLSEVRRGSTILMMAYGYSGAGKTTTLLGDSNIQGIVSLHLAKYSKQIADVRLQIVEVYGRIDPRNGKFVPKTGQGLWVFPWGKDSVQAEYVGSYDVFVKNGAMDFDHVKALLKEKNPRTSMKDVFHNNVSGDWRFDSDLKTVLRKVEDVRKNDDYFRIEGQGDSMAHIRATPNNPTSSRGTLIVMLDFEFKDGGEGGIVVVDLAGAEDPLTMIGGFMSVLKKDDRPRPSEAPTWEAAAQREEAKAACAGDADMIIMKYLHEMGNTEYLNEKLAECLQFRDFLVPCVKGSKSCQAIQVYGETLFRKPDLQADMNYVRKSDRPEGSVVRDPAPLKDLKNQKTVTMDQRFKDFTFVYNYTRPGFRAATTVELTFPLRDVLAAMRKRQPATDTKLHDVKFFKDIQCSWRRRKPDDPVGVEYMTDFPVKFTRLCEVRRCMPVNITGPDGKTSVKSMDMQLERVDKDLVTGAATGKTWVPNMCKKVLKFMKKSKTGTCDESATGTDPRIPYVGTLCTWPDNLFEMKKKDDVERNFPKIKNPASTMKLIRKEFWEQVQVYLDEYKAHEEKLREVWDVHLAYFTQVIMPMAQEALYVNEMLNQMKKYLEQVNAWGVNPDKDPWPAESKEAKLPSTERAERQLIDVTEGSGYTAYSPTKLIQPTDLNTTYYEEFGQVNEGGEAVDRILGLTMFEYIRRHAMARENGNFKILFGTFVRADKPNGDPDCSGAAMSLNFAQRLVADSGRSIGDDMKKFYR